MLQSGAADIGIPPEMQRTCWLRSGALIAIVDTGPLHAVADLSDVDHKRCRDTLERGDLHLVIPALVVAETTQLIEQRLGPEAEARFLSGVSEFEIELPAKEDWARIAELVGRYADFPLGGVDASVVALAERLNSDTVITLDHRHFRAVRPAHCEAFKLLPE